MTNGDWLRSLTDEELEKTYCIRALLLNAGNAR